MEVVAGPEEFSLAIRFVWRSIQRGQNQSSMLLLNSCSIGKTWVDMMCFSAHFDIHAMMQELACCNTQ